MGDQNMYQRIAAGKGKNEIKFGFIEWFLGRSIVGSKIYRELFC
jgi:hypothetical protein